MQAHNAPKASGEMLFYTGETGEFGMRNIIFILDKDSDASRTSCLCYIADPFQYNL